MDIFKCAVVNTASVKYFVEWRKANDGECRFTCTDGCSFWKKTYNKSEYEHLFENLLDGCDSQDYIR